MAGNTSLSTHNEVQQLTSQNLIRVLPLKGINLEMKAIQFCFHVVRLYLVLHVIAEII